MAKKTIALVITGLLLSACHSQPSPVTTLPTRQTDGNAFAQAEQRIHQLKAQGHQNISVIDVGKGKQTPAVLALSVKFQANSHFKIQDSVSGIPSGATLNALRVFLLESNGLIASGDISSLVKHDAVISRTGSPSSPYTRTFVFANVPANTSTTHRYYVGVSPLLQVSSGPPPAPYTLNLLATPNTHYFANTSELVAISNGGGESNSGAVFVDANYQVSDLTPLSITMTLKDETGAQIDADVTVNNGSTGPLPPISVS